MSQSLDSFPAIKETLKSFSTNERVGSGKLGTALFKHYVKDLITSVEVSSYQCISKHCW